MGRGGEGHWFYRNKKYSFFSPAPFLPTHWSAGKGQKPGPSLFHTDNSRVCGLSVDGACDLKLASHKKVSSPKLMDEQGSSAVEFALVAGVFFMFFLGIIEYGWIMTQQIVLSHAVSEGARAGVCIPDQASDQERMAAARTTAINVFSLVGIIEDEDIAVEIREPGVYMGQPLPRRIFVNVSSWAYEPLVGYLPASAMPAGLKASTMSAFP